MVDITMINNTFFSIGTEVIPLKLTVD